MSKTKKLLIGILLDAIGCVSYIIPGIGEFVDIIWAPIAGWLMTKLYEGKSGKVAGIVAFVEEAVPGLDIIPTFTLMWIYTYLLKKEN
ncbi:hypothetical protein KFZ70_11650 [Tamlana fucoidanivorans]|uniref:Uncharacterized protein n=1 Tax=Allotamlana fucoidanivorans TaxID=2583814 RepID=A0A5C4SHB9_9FLAO|nr:hypothetical protein [Tamlana fucoidanivorans]TNJ43077.1 hypothetical protein FGF67_11990 [Tamlana fucoidanivorans]